MFKMNLGNLRNKWKLRKAASASNILDGDRKDPPKEKAPLATKYGEQRQVVVGGKALKEIEVTGEKQQETLPETRRHRRISKSRRAAEFEGDELKVQCRDLNPADYEGWLFKKSTGGPLHTVAWKQCWVVLKNGILYLYKTSFDIAAQHAYSVRNFSVAPVEEKRKHTFKLVPKNVPPEALQDAKGVVFACDSDADVEKWCDVLNKAALGFIIQQSHSEKGALLNCPDVIVSCCYCQMRTPERFWRIKRRENYEKGYNYSTNGIREIKKEPYTSRNSSI